MGKITLYLNEEEYVLETGDSVKIPAYLKHKWVNHFEKKRDSLIFCYSADFFNISIKNRMILIK